MLWLFTQPCCYPSFQNLRLEKSKSIIWYICTLASPVNTSDTKPYKEEVREDFDDFIFGQIHFTGCLKMRLYMMHPMVMEMWMVMIRLTWVLMMIELMIE